MHQNTRTETNTRFIRQPALTGLKYFLMVKGPRITAPHLADFQVSLKLSQVAENFTNMYAKRQFQQNKTEDSLLTSKILAIKNLQE